MPQKEKTRSEQKSSPFAVFLPLLVSFPRFLLSLGNEVIFLLSSAAKYIFKGIKIPVLFVARLFAKAAVKIADFAVKSFRSQVGEEHFFTGRLPRALKNFFKTAVREPKTIPAMLAYYIRMGLSQYTKLVKYLVLLALPAAAFAVLLFTVGHYRNASVALRIDVGDKTLGYVMGEGDYIKARDMARSRLGLDRMNENDSSVLLPKVTYTLQLIQLNQYTGTEALCDAIIESSESNIVNACGIYIDGEFLCAVKNESDARRVFDSVLEADKNYGTDGIISFVQDINYVEGLYPDTENTIWDSAKLYETVHSTRQEPVYHTIEKDDTLLNIAKEYGVSLAKLYELNPDYNEKTRLSTGNELLISEEISFLTVKVVKTEVYTEETPFKTVEVPSDALYAGTRRTVVTGAEGIDQITAVVTYVNGRKISTEEVARLTLKEPVDCRVQVGTKVLESSYSVGSFGGVLMWPAVNAYNINSPYGYRWGKMHTAIDIGSAVGTSSGKLVVAAAEGTVIMAGRHSSYGNYVKIDHGNGLQTLYAHCMDNSITVSIGEHVTAGQAIARIGQTGYATGPHLHFEVIVNGTCVDPTPYLGID